MDQDPYREYPLPKLPNYERTAACLLVVVILFILGLNLYLDEGKSFDLSPEPHYLQSPYIEVTVKGAVAKPGVYQVTKGMLVEEVIRMAEPLEAASLNTIKLDSKITRRRIINIRAKSKNK